MKSTQFLSELSKIEDSAPKIQRNARRVTDSNKRLDEYILGSLRKSGLESAVNVEEHKDGYRISLQSDKDVYIDAYLDGDDVVVEGSLNSGKGYESDAASYAKFAGIPEEQAKDVVRRVFDWMHAMEKDSGKDVDTVGGVRDSARGSRVSDSIYKIADDKLYTADYLKDNPPSWVGDKELWNECVNKATHNGEREIAAIVPLTIYKRKGGSKALSKKEKEVRAAADEKRMSAETSREGVEDSISDVEKIARDVLGKDAYIQKQTLSEGFAVFISSKKHEDTGLVSYFHYKDKTEVKSVLNDDPEEVDTDTLKALKSLESQLKKAKISDSSEKWYLGYRYNKNNECIYARAYGKLTDSVAGKKANTKYGTLRMKVFDSEQDFNRAVAITKRRGVKVI